MRNKAWKGGKLSRIVKMLNDQIEHIHRGIDSFPKVEVTEQGEEMRPKEITVNSTGRLFKF